MSKKTKKTKKGASDVMHKGRVLRPVGNHIFLLNDDGSHSIQFDTLSDAMGKIDSWSPCGCHIQLMKDGVVIRDFPTLAAANKYVQYWPPIQKSKT